MLKTRIITSVLLITGFLLVLFFAPSSVWSLLTLVATSVAMWEWSNLIKLNRTQMLLTLAALLVIGLGLIFAANRPIGQYHDAFILSILILSTLFWLLLTPLWLIFRRTIKQKFVMAFLGLTLLLGSWLGLVGLHSLSPWLLLSVLTTVWLADSAAYFSGKRLGKHKLAPAISPGKTWEGVAGAIVAVTIYGAVICYTRDVSYWFVVGLWCLVVLSIIGDLFESMIKRQAGVKDSSQLLPGHGGVLDRVDGIMPVLPLVLSCVYFPLILNLSHRA